MLNGLRTVFVKWPVGLFMMCLLPLMFFIIKRQVRFGCWVDKFGDKEWLFLPCTNKAKKVLAKHCQGMKKLVMGAFLVPKESYWMVYECVMHDPDDPQCMTAYSPILRCNITDTP